MVFKKIIFQNSLMANETPSRPPLPFMANAILNFHFDFLHPSLSHRRYIKWGETIQMPCSQAGTLRDHIKTHSLEKPNQCKWCNLPSIAKSSLSQHLLTHSGERYYHCNEWGSSFSRARHLKRHLLIHSGEKPHKCTQCDYACSWVDALSYHIKTHFLQNPNQSQNQNFFII